MTVLDQESLEIGLPNAARIYDFLLGGKDNYAADREAALALTTAVPGAPRAARDNRAFLRRAVHVLAAEAGISQFLDIGTGLPAQGSVHEIARAVNPAAKVVYADNDRVVVSHARALLAKDPGMVAVEGDVRFPRELLAARAVQDTIDFARPVGVLLVAVLHFVDDLYSPWPEVRWLVDQLAPGSHLVISHATADQIPAEAARQARAVYDEALIRATARTRGDIGRFFDGTELIPPGLVDVAAWRSGRELPTRPTVLWAGIGRKTAQTPVS